MPELLELTILDCEKSRCFKGKGLLVYVDRNREGADLERTFLNKLDLERYIDAVARNYVYTLKFVDKETSNYVGEKV